MLRLWFILIVLLFAWSPSADAQNVPTEVDARVKPVVAPHPRISIQFDRTPLLLAIRQLNAAADGKATVSYRSDVPLPDAITGTYKDKPFEEVLRSVLKQSRRKLSYRLESGTIFVVRPGSDFPRKLLWPVFTRDEEDDLQFIQESSHPTPIVQIGHTRAVRWLGFTPNGRQLASASDDGSIYIWDMNGRRLLRTLAGTTGGSGFTDNGKTLVSIASTFMLQWRTATGHLRQKRNNNFGGFAESVAVHPNGTIVTAGTDGSVRSFATFRDQARILVPPVDGHLYQAGITTDGSLVYAYLNRLTVQETEEEKKDLFKYSTVYFWKANSEKPWTSIKTQDGGRLRQVAMSPNRRLIFLATDKNAVEIRSITNNMMQLKSIPINTNDVQLVFNKSSTRLYICAGNRIEIWNISDRFALIKSLTNVGYCRSLALSDDERFLAIGSNNGQVSVWDAQKYSPVIAFAPMAESIDKCFFTKDASHLVTLGGSGNRLWDVGMTHYPQRMAVRIDSRFVLSPDGAQIAVPNGNGGVTLLTNDTFKPVRDLIPVDGQHNSTIESISWDRKGGRLMGAGNGGAYVWDTETGECLAGPLILSPDVVEKSPVIFSGFTGDNKTVVLRFRSGQVGIWDITDRSGIPLHEITPKPAKAADAPFVGVPEEVPEGETAPVANPVETEPKLEPWKDFPVEINGFDVGYDRRTGVSYLAVTKNTETLLYRISNGQYITTCNGFDPKFDPWGRYLLVANGSSMKSIDIASGNEIKTVSNVGGNPVFSSDRKLLALSNLVGLDSRPLITILDATGSFGRIARLSGHTGLINTVAFSSDNTRLISGAQDGTTRLWDVKPDPPAPFPVPGQKIAVRKERERQLAAFIGVRGNTDSDEYAIIVPDGYYMASKGALGRVAFRFGDTTFSFDQFDLRLNRPDIVLSRLGRAPAPLIASLQSAHRMRLYKMGLTEPAAEVSSSGGKGIADTDVQLPTVELKESLPLSVPTRDLTFAVSLEDTKTELSALLVSVNDVPIGGIRGIDLSARHVQATEEPVAIRLMPGMNKIQISVRNQRGDESLRETQYVTCQAPLPSPRLFVLAVGVSRYKNSDYNLAVADKDALELSAFFSDLGSKASKVPVKVPAKPTSAANKISGARTLARSKRIASTRRYRYVAPPRTKPVVVTSPLLPLYGSSYESVFVKTLTNEEATGAAIRQTAAEFLSQAREEDHIILFFAGHGKIDIHDKNQTYYFLTHEADPDDMAHTALPYTDLESILDQTTARQRLILLDTCESGDIYLDPVKVKEIEDRIAAGKLKLPPTTTPPVALNTQGIAALDRGLPGESLTEDDAATLVRDLFADLRRSMGAEVITAATGIQKALERGGNGVFTRAVLHVLQKSKGTSLPVSALRNQVAEIVRKETKDQQIPIMRAESVDFDFPILLGRP